MNESYPTCDDRLSPSSSIWSSHVTLKKKRIFVGLFRCIPTLECIILRSYWLRGEEAPKKKNRFYKGHSRNVIYHNHLLQLLSSEGVTSYTQSSEAVTSYTHSSSCSDFSHVKQSSHTYQFLSYKHHLKESRPLWIILYTMIVFFWLRSSEGEVGGWGRDPKKCTGRGWRMGSSTV